MCYFYLDQVDESFLPGTDEAVIKRTLTAQKNNGESRTVIQIQHLRWPDKFVPASVDSILALLKQTRESRIEPILIHCRFDWKKASEIYKLYFFFNFKIK